MLSPDELRAIDVRDRIDELLDTGAYDWARETLEGIRDTIERTGRCSIRQEEAVTHIIIGRLKHDGGQ